MAHPSIDALAINEPRPGEKLAKIMESANNKVGGYITIAILLHQYKYSSDTTPLQPLY